MATERSQTFSAEFVLRELETYSRAGMALPFLPGNSFNPNVSRYVKLMAAKRVIFARLLQVGKTKFHKSHTFDFRGPVPTLDDSKPGIGQLNNKCLVIRLLFAG